MTVVFLPLSRYRIHIFLASIRRWPMLTSVFSHQRFFQNSIPSLLFILVILRMVGKRELHVWWTWKLLFVAGEIEEEWMMYRSSLVSSGYYNKTVWMDVRGNHDNTNQNSTRQHYYYQYGTCRDEDRVYNRIIRHSFGNYCFIGVDATLSPCTGDL